MLSGRRIRPIWLLPVVVCLLGAAALVSAHIERGRTRTALEGVTRDHAASLARLVRLSAANAAECTERVAELVRGDLQRAALLPPGPTDSDIEVRVEDGPSGETGLWGSIPPSERAAFLSDMEAREADLLVDDGAPGRFGLVCLLHKGRTGRVIACIEADRFSELRRQSGIGALLGSVAGPGVRYIALQDGSGIIASTPQPPAVDMPADEPFLKAALSDPDSHLDFRRLRDATGTVIEGIGRFDLADGSRAAIRIGIDASPLERFEQQTRIRLGFIWVVVSSVSLASLLLVRLVVRGERRRERAERDLERREEEHRHWRTIGLISATVAHEVRNPLNTIGIAVQRLGREFDVGPGDRTEFGELLSIVSSETDRLNRVVTGFLELGRPLSLKRDLRRADELVRQALAPLLLRSEREGKRLELDSRCRGEVEVDIVRFGQVMANIVGNALDAVEPGGNVRVVAECDNGGLTVKVGDDGPGMDAAAVERAWQPFATTKAHGTGLGLPLARRLVVAHGGEIELRSVPGRGTTVTVRLPVRPVRQEEGDPHESE